MRCKHAHVYRMEGTAFHLCGDCKNVVDRVVSRGKLRWVIYR